MFLYNVATNPIWLWIAFVLAAAGSMMVGRYLLLENSSSQYYSPRLAQQAGLGLMLMIVGLMISGLYAACYGDMFYVILSIALLIVLSVSSYLLNTSHPPRTSRQK